MEQQLHGDRVGNKTLTFAATLIIVWISGYLLIAGRGLLIPLVVAIFIWNLLNTIHNTIQKTPVIGRRMPYSMSMVLSLIVVALLVKVVIDIISDNVSQVIDSSARYQENLARILSSIDSQFHIKLMANFERFFSNLSIQGIFVNIYGVFTTITGSAVLITLYLIFLFIEQHYFSAKLDALFTQPNHRALVNSIINQIVKDTQTYMGIKTLMSGMTATASWMVMRYAYRRLMFPWWT